MYIYVYVYVYLGFYYLSLAKYFRMKYNSKQRIHASKPVTGASNRIDAMIFHVY